MPWFQHEITLPAFSRGFHPITHEVLAGIPEIREIRIGLLQVFILHTSASLTINENAYPDLPRDLAMAFTRIRPEEFPYSQTMEGSASMPAYRTSAML